MTARDDVLGSIEEIRKQFPRDATLMEMMGLRLGRAEYDDLHREGVLDGPDDKKIDFFLIDWDSGCAILVQAFESPDWDDVDPPANKASDLNTAISWLLDSDLQDIPREPIRAAARQLRDGLASGEVNTVEAYYVHNCKHSKNADDELRTVHASLRNKLEGWAEKAGAPIASGVLQFGLADIIGLHESRYSSIQVTDDVAIGMSASFGEMAGPNWRAVYVAVPATDLVRLVEKYGDALYSANIRDYLGGRAYKRNINRQIEETATHDPKNFWVFNNGITLITRNVSPTTDRVECSGLAVVNGAQTIGSLTEASRRGSVDEVMLSARIIESSDQDLIQDIIRYNNTQNPIKPWELRVLDPVQKRIEHDFKDKLKVNYQFRRGVGRSGPEDVLCEKLGPWLNSFYGDPTTSHRNSPELFDDEAKYRSLFNDHSDVRHLLFAYRLGEAVAATKDEYRRKVDAETANETEGNLYSYFRYGAFTHVAIYLVGELLAEIFGGGPAVKNRFGLASELEESRGEAIEALTRVVKFALPVIPPELEGQDAYEQIRSKEGIMKLAGRIRASANQFQAVQPETVEALKVAIRVL